MAKRFQLHHHPWLGMLATMFAWFVALDIGSILATYPLKLTPGSQKFLFTTDSLAHILSLFVLIPFVLRLPLGKQSYQAYLDSIRLSRVRPFFQLLLLALSCYLIQVLCQAGGVLVYRASHGLPVTRVFVRYTFSWTNLVPAESWSWLSPLPSIFEEVGSRGMVLSLFLTRYSKPKAILFSALGFGAMHLLNLTHGQETVWVLGELVWSTIFGLFYGVLVLKANSLWPAMLLSDGVAADGRRVVSAENLAFLLPCRLSPARPWTPIKSLLSWVLITTTCWVRSAWSSMTTIPYGLILVNTKWQFDRLCLKKINIFSTRAHL